MSELMVAKTKPACKSDPAGSRWQWIYPVEITNEMSA